MVLIVLSSETETYLTYYVHARCRANPFSSMNSKI